MSAPIALKCLFNEYSKITHTFSYYRQDIGLGVNKSHHGVLCRLPISIGQGCSSSCLPQVGNIIIGICVCAERSLKMSCTHFRFTLDDIDINPCIQIILESYLHDHIQLYRSARPQRDEQLDELYTHIADELLIIFEFVSSLVEYNGKALCSHIEVSILHGAYNTG